MAKNSLCVLKYCFLLSVLLISLHFALKYFNLDKKYKSLKKDLDFGLETMINILPDYNVKKRARYLKRKYL